MTTRRWQRGRKWATTHGTDRPIGGLRFPGRRAGLVAQRRGDAGVKRADDRACR
jgi:hypothetical protein